MPNTFQACSLGLPGVINVPSPYCRILWNNLTSDASAQHGSIAFCSCLVGILAGKISPALRALSTIQELGPSLGLSVNISK